MLDIGTSKNLYANVPELKAFDRSLYYPQFVFISGVVAGQQGCETCVFSEKMKDGCSSHPCGGGYWTTETQAAIIRLEES